MLRILLPVAALLSIQACQSNYISNPLPVAHSRAFEVTGTAAPGKLQSTTRLEQQLLTRFQNARALVEHHTGIELSHITLSLANDDMISDEVKYETRRLITTQFSNPQFAAHFLDAVMHGQSGTYAALYATRKSQVMISDTLLQSYQRSLPDDQEIRDAAILALLIHELVHAADDVRYNIHERRDLNFRASFAQSAAYEGHAQWVTRTICEQAGCKKGLETLDKFMFGSRKPPNQLTQSVQAVSRNVLEYSYVEGERFVAALAKRPNGSALIEHMLHHPPQDPIQILDPGSYPNSLRDKHNQHLLDVAASIEHPWVEQPWTSVPTSPLKGVNLRADPDRRDAAVQGFTQLITSMVAVQLYDQSEPARVPMEVTLLTAESGDTASLFAQTLHQNSITVATTIHRGRVRVDIADKSMPNAPMHIEHLLTSDTSNDGLGYYTLVARLENKVVQIAGIDASESLFLDYANTVLATLQLMDIKQVQYSALEGRQNQSGNGRADL